MQVFVVGMHRSGTSAVTRLLNMMGLYFGPEGLNTGYNQENPKGFWERKDFRALNDRTLSAGNGSWYRLTRFSLEQIPADERKSIDEKASELILELDAHRPWVLKEPRFCLLMDIYRPYLEAPIAVMTLRNPVEIAMSLETRNDFPVPFGLALWELYTRSAFLQTKGMKRIVVEHAELMRDPVATVKKLYQQLQDLNVGPIRLPLEHEITSFIEPTLHRQRAKEADMVQLLNHDQIRLFNGIKDGSLLTKDDLGSMSGLGAYILKNDEAARLLNNKVTALEKEKSSLISREEVLKQERNLLKTKLELEQEKAQNQIKEQQLQAQKLSQVAADKLKKDLEPLLEGQLEIKHHTEHLAELREWVKKQDDLQSHVAEVLKDLAKVKNSFSEMSQDTRDLKISMRGMASQEDQTKWFASISGLIDTVGKHIKQNQNQEANWESLFSALRGNQAKIEQLQEHFSEAFKSDTLQDLRIMRSNNEQLQAEFKKVATALQHSQQEGADRLEHQTQSLLNQMGTQYQTLRFLEEELSAVTTGIQQSANAQIEMIDVQELMAKSQQEMADSQEKMAELQQKHQAVLESKLDHIGKGVEELERLHHKLGKEQSANEMLRAQLNEKQQAMAELKHQLATLQEEFKSVQINERELALKLNTASAEKAELNKDLLRLEDERERLSKDLDLLMVDQDQLMTEHELLEAKHDELQIEQNELEKERRELQAEYLQLEEHHEQLKQHRDQISLDRDQLRRQRDDERKLVQERTQDRDRLQRDLQLSEAELQNRMARIDVLEKSLQERTEDIAILEEKLAEATFAFQDIDPKFRQLKARYQDIKESKLWALGLFVNRMRSMVGMRNPVATRVDPGFMLSREEHKAAAALVKPKVAIVVPVYNAYDELRRCLDSLVKYVPNETTVILINDCSPDERVADLLADYASRHVHFQHEHNLQNLGFTKTVNRGLRIADGKDVVILNSDTIVTPDWLDGLQQCAYSQPAVATATPLSNAAGAFSVPENNQVNLVPEGFTLDEWASFIRRNSLKLWPRVPTGNGFCMYIRREALNAVGELDEERFPRGYGEENDFCMRAGKAGFVHLIDDTTFIYHARNASFGPEREKLIKQGRATIDEIHPEYTREVRKWLKNDPVDRFRKKLRQKLKEKGNNPITESKTPARSNGHVLYILHAGGGGTKLTSEDLFKKVSVYRPALMLRTHLRKWELLRAEKGKMQTLAFFEFSDDWLIDQPLQQDRIDIVNKILDDYQIDLVHIRHLLANGPELIDLIKQRGLPVVFSFHDFYTVCPTIQLIDNTRKHCAGDCKANQSSSLSLTSKDCTLTKSWYRRPIALKDKYVHDWRERLKQPLEACDAWVTTSKSARDLVVKHFPRLDRPKFEIIEHGRHFGNYKKIGVAPNPNEPARVVIFGALGPSKGVDLISEVLKMNYRGDQRFEFHILGNKIPSFKPDKFGGIYHGSYENRDLPKLLENIKPSFSVIASIWPETFCHTLTESWACGIPVFGCDIGAVKDRIEELGGGWLCDYTSPEIWFQQMLNVLDNPEDVRRKFEDIQNMGFKTVTKMALEYLELYDRVGVKTEASPVA
jgi:GT2 family glycosyltransferase/glycosyltransferase involved in cell wall biosynthesis/chromosome segregation ATPase